MENNLTKALLALLQKGIVNFTYRKVDGSVRTAIGTRNLCLACKVLGVSVPMPKGKKENPTAYYDIEKGDWRSFKAENVLSIDGVEVSQIKGIKNDRIVPVGSMEEVDIPLNIGGGFGTFGGGIPKEEIRKAIEKLDKDIEIPIGKSGGVGIAFGMPSSGGIGGSHKDNEPKNFDLGKIKTALGMPNGTPFVKGEFGMGKPIGKSVAVPMGEGKGMVFTPLAVSEEHTTLPIGGMPIEDFAKLVAHYVLEEFISRFK